MNTQLDTDGCIRLLAAITRQWWRDARRSPRMLAELAEWLEVDLDELENNVPAKFRAKSHECDDNDDLPTIEPWPRHQRGPAYTRRGIGGS